MLTTQFPEVQQEISGRSGEDQLTTQFLEDQVKNYVDN